jgi:hypothetical protein
VRVTGGACNVPPGCDQHDLGHVHHADVPPLDAERSAKIEWRGTAYLHDYRAAPARGRPHPSAGVTVQQPSDGDTSQSAGRRMLCTSAKSAAQMEDAPVDWFTSNRSAVVAVFRT